LIGHNHYQRPGGEDSVVQNETHLLKMMGHEVETFMVSNDEIIGFQNKVKAALQVLDNPAITAAFDQRITNFVPQVVHFHNFFPRLTGAIKRSLDRRIPTLHTLHNYRLICAEGSFHRHGTSCVRCVGSSLRLPAIQRGCYRGSRVGTFFVGRVGRAYRRLFLSHERYLTPIALTEFARKQMMRDGYDPTHIAVKGNFAPDLGLGEFAREKRILFIGRLTRQKGVDHFLRIARKVDAEFEIIGDGPDRQDLSQGAPPNVVFRGWLNREAVIERIKRAAALAIPSRSCEGFPMVIPEAFSTGTPVFASYQEPLNELIENEYSGMLLPVDDEAAWVAGLQRIIDEPAFGRRLGNVARGIYEEKYSPAQNGKQLVAIYEDAIARASMDELYRVTHGLNHFAMPASVGSERRE